MKVWHCRALNPELRNSGRADQLEAAQDRPCSHVLLWGVPADPCPAATCFSNVRVIHLQSSHSSPSYQSQADDFAAILTPAEVLAPLLSAGMEQWHVLTCQRVPDF